MGSNAQGSGANAIAIGSNAQATQSGAIAMGMNAASTGANAKLQRARHRLGGGR